MNVFRNNVIEIDLNRIMTLQNSDEIMKKLEQYLIDLDNSYTRENLLSQCYIWK